MSDMTPRQATDELTAFIDRWLPTILNVRDALAVVAQSESRTQDAEARYAVLEAKSTNAQQRLEDIKKEMQGREDSLKLRLAKLEADMQARLDKRISDCTAQEDAATKRIAMLAAQIDSLNAQVSDAADQRLSVEAAIVTASANLKDLRSQIARLSEGAASLAV